MTFECTDYRIESDRRAKEMANSGKYYLTGRKLVQREEYRMKILGVDNLKNVSKELLDKLDIRESPRYKERKPRADYGHLSVDLDTL